MRPIGFSTGALAKGDVARALAIQRSTVGASASAVELSALRESELGPLLDAVPSLATSGFSYVSLHAPGRLSALPEEAVFGLLSRFPPHWPIVAHPEILLTPSLWRSLGPRLCIENMDDRKSTGRTVEELHALFEVYPKASFCLDVGHARQIDPTMAGASAMLDRFGSRLRQLHVSEVGPGGEHLPLSPSSSAAFRLVAPLVPDTCPLIVESAIAAGDAARELAAVAEAFSERFATVTA